MRSSMWAISFRLTAIGFACYFMGYYHSFIALAAAWFSGAHMQTRHVCVCEYFRATVLDRVWVCACAGVLDFQFTNCVSVCVCFLEAGAGSGYKETSNSF